MTGLVRQVPRYLYVEWFDEEKKRWLHDWMVEWALRRSWTNPDRNSAEKKIDQAINQFVLVTLDARWIAPIVEETPDNQDPRLRFVQRCWWINLFDRSLPPISVLLSHLLNLSWSSPSTHSLRRDFKAEGMAWRDEFWFVDGRGLVMSCSQVDAHEICSCGFRMPKWLWLIELWCQS